MKTELQNFKNKKTTWKIQIVLTLGFLVGEEKVGFLDGLTTGGDDGFNDGAENN